MSSKLPKLYTELADWWQLISPTNHYQQEAAFFGELFKQTGAKTILELGAGGGNNAYYLKKDFKMTLTDLSPEMLKMSQKQNPDCEHIVGDMRTLRLHQQFDGVFIHDAIEYMLTKKDLLAAFKTAYGHCDPGGMIVTAPDTTLETFNPQTKYHEYDSGNRSIRYMEWVSDDDPTDTKYNYDFVIALKQGGQIRSIVDRQFCGLFSRKTWLDTLKQAGFSKVKRLSDPTDPDNRIDIFIGYKN